jgi:dipeptidyl aminopeptidase/acylaminoacyl peptidase
LSPDGKKLAFLAPDERVLNVWVGDVGSTDFKPVTADRKRGILQYRWAFDGRHLLYLQDSGGDENWRLYGVDLETGDVADHTPLEGVQTTILGTSERKPSEVLLGINKDDPRYHDVYRLDLRTGELTKELANPGFGEWIVDHDLVVRGAVRPTDEGGSDIVLRDGDNWTVAIAIGADDYLINVTHDIGFDGDGHRLFHTSVASSDKARLVAFDTRTPESTVIAEDPDYDVFAIGFMVWDGLRHPTTHEPQLVPVLKDRLTYVVLDQAVADDLKALEAVEDGEVSIISRDLSDTTWIVGFNRDDAPGHFYVYDRPSKIATFLFTTQPDLEEFTLANVEPISLRSRDGLPLHGYVTFPPGVKRESLPAVLHVHGGPWGGRHLWGYQAINQWIANRGYACIEIDFRGSGGYGKAFLNASAREWAGKMHDDLLDGIDYCVEQGWIDREHVAIFGGSYGGYAALVGATFTPDVFKCAVDYVGPSNLITLLESIPPYWFAVAKQFDKLLGNPERDRDFLWERSPLSRVDDISIPVLIAQGANDPRVKQAESEQIVAAMKERGLPYGYLLFENEGHGFYQPENREKFHLAAERFFATHLGGRAQEELAAASQKAST